MSNKNFKNISSGTPGAFNTGFVAKAGVVGSQSAPSVKSPFTVIDVTVDVGALGTVFPVIISLGDRIPVGSIITQASANGRGSVSPGTTAAYQLGLSGGGTGPIGLTLITATDANDVVADQSINGGFVLAPADLALVALVPLAYTYPVLIVSGGPSDTVGNINVKIVYFSA